MPYERRDKATDRRTDGRTDVRTDVCHEKAAELVRPGTKWVEEGEERRKKKKEIETSFCYCFYLTSVLLYEYKQQLLQHVLKH